MSDAGVAELRPWRRDVVLPGPVSAVKDRVTPSSLLSTSATGSPGSNTEKRPSVEENRLHCAPCCSPYVTEAAVTIRKTKRIVRRMN